MDLKRFAVLTFFAGWLMSGTAGAAEPVAIVNMPELNAAAQKVTVAEGDISDRPYRVLGQVFVRAKKVGVFDRPPIEEKTDTLLRARAAELGADAVINVRRERGGVTIFNFGYMDGIGTAVTFDGAGIAPTPQRTEAVPSTSPAPSDSPVPPSVATNPPLAAPTERAGIPLVANPAETLTALLNAINSGNAGAASDLFAADATIEDPAGSRPLEGKSAIESYLRALVGRNVRYELVLPIGNADTRTAAMALRIHAAGAAEGAIQTFTFRPDSTILRMTIYRNSASR
jgi:hypothetical protein